MITFAIDTFFVEYTTFIIISVATTKYENVLPLMCANEAMNKMKTVKVLVETKHLFFLVGPMVIFFVYFKQYGCACVCYVLTH